MSVLHIDLETSSLLDLKKVGVSRYSRHPSTVVTVLAWAFDDGPIQSVTMPERFPLGLPDEVYEHIIKGRAFAAWNAHFEASFLENWFGIHLLSDQMECTMQRSLYGGLPASLAMAGAALRLSVQKDTTAHRLMLAMAKPRPQPKRGLIVPVSTFWHEDPIEGPAKLRDLAKYCEQDVAAEREISNHIPNLPDYEKTISRLDWQSNQTGVKLDLPLIDRLIEISSAETSLLNAECAKATNGYVTSPGTQRDRLVSWFDFMGFEIDDVAKETVQTALDMAVDLDLDPEVTHVLGIRQLVAKSSIAKLQAMLNTVDNDGRVRGLLQYYGAGRTGRWTGRLIQPQNFPRPMKTANKAIYAIREWDFDQEGLRSFYGEPLTVVSSCLRGCLVPSDGKVFFVYDLAQIEARVLAWLGGQTDILMAFVRYDKGEGPDVYTYVANQLNLGSRDAGKVAVLGLGYGMGPPHFIDFAKGYGITLSKEEATKIVYDWRDANSNIVAFWSRLDTVIKSLLTSASAQATFQLDERITLETARARNGDKLLTIKLPSGRRLFYRNIRMEIDNHDPKRFNSMAITYDGIDQYTKKWGPIRSWGAKFAENITQAVARDIIAEAALNMNGDVAKLVLSVHDELVFEVDPAYADDISINDLFLRGKKVIENNPAWAEGFPIAADGAVMHRYGKP